MAPSVRIGPYRVRFYASDRGEPPHVHVLRDNLMTKIWLDSLSVAENRGFSAREVAHVRRIIRERRQEFLEDWHAFFTE